MSSSSQDQSPPQATALFSSNSFKYGILILFVAIFVASFMCSMFVRRRAARAMQWYMPEMEHVRQAQKIPRVPPRLSDVYIEKDVRGLVNSVPLSSQGLSGTQTTSTPATTPKQSSRFPRLGRPVTTDPGLPSSSDVVPTSLPTRVQLVVFVAMPSRAVGAGKEVSDDDLDEMALTEKIGGTVEIGVTALDISDNQGLLPSSGN